MNAHKTIWQIIGPVIVAVALVAVVFIVPQGFGNVSKQTEQKAAVSLSTNVFKGNKIKSQAIDDGYVPFIGSSELSRMDPLHPSVLAAKYHRSYQPFLLGKPGTQSLVHYFALSGVMRHLKNRKVVFIVSPQWFTKQGQMPTAFDYYYSPLETIHWLTHAHDSVATRYAAQRLLTMPSASSDRIMKAAITNVAAGKAITSGQRTYLTTKEKLLVNADDLYSRLVSGRRLRHIQQAEQQLPAHDSTAQLTKVANRLGAQATGNNRFGVKDSFYNLRLRGHNVQNLRQAERNFNYTQSPEYSDMELLLSQFAKYHVQVMVVIPPVNHKWAKYTGLSDKMYAQTDRKIKTQLQSQGFTHIVDLTHDGGQKYFMEDTIHLGWRGWLKMDQQVKPFLSRKQSPAHYRIQNRFFSRTWQLAQNK